MLIFRPIITERSLLEQEQGKYYFYVGRNISKGQIREQFQTTFGVKPLSVNTMISKCKSHMDWKRRTTIKKSDQKKVVITVAKDAKIKLLQVETKKSK